MAYRVRSIGASRALERSPRGPGSRFRGPKRNGLTARDPPRA